MTVKYFADTNVILYAIGQDPHKTTIARNILKSRPVISSQVVNEAINVCLRKLSFEREKAYEFAESVMRYTEVLPVDATTIRKSAYVAIRYQLSNWDALILAAALLGGCDTLYSEDFQAGQVFEQSLTVVNPFC
ncbi:MAG TPA: PIN domain-containing protein [Spirochaetota bacterium]|jgi:predicted nucleic acid-binding protein|nr:PIN domain-containing protein [Spirochaetota bacterium]